MTTATRARPRARPRSVDLEAQDGPPPYEQHARAAYLANRAKNEATRDEKKAKEACHREMLAAGKDRFEFTVTDNKGTHIVDAVIAAKEEDVIDVTVLYDEMVTKAGRLADFLAIVKTTQEGVKEKMGSNTLALCKKPKVGEPVLSIKERK